MKKFCRAVAVWLTVLALALGAQAAELVVGGNAIGLELQTQGVTVVDFSLHGPEAAGLALGDRIVAVDAAPVDSAQALKERVAASGGAPLDLTVERNGKNIQLSVQPSLGASGWHLGIFVRDRVTGIGTVTYYDPASGTFGALGHGVSGPDGGLLQMRTGSALASTVTGVERGRAGKAGALKGAVCREGAGGQVTRNTPCGIFGTLPAPQGPVMEVALAEQVTPGPALILSTVAGTSPAAYEVEILQVDCTAGGHRDILLQVTDEALLRATGGIVQGMSGSPIIQNGRLVGAVTHVLVNQPDTGYGIFIENMLEAAG